jgi:hypothetical protein
MVRKVSKKSCFVMAGSPRIDGLAGRTRPVPERYLGDDEEHARRGAEALHPIEARIRHELP